MAYDIWRQVAEESGDDQVMTREIVFMPAWDKGPSYGKHGVDMRWYLKGPKGVIQFVVFTNWLLKQNRPHWDSHEQALFLLPQPADLGYHSPVPMYEGQEPMSVCDVLPPGEKCYYDGSGLNAERIFELLVEQGGEAVWKELEVEYRRRFEGEQEK